MSYKISSLTEKVLDSHINQQVTVWMGDGVRNSFDTQICLCGILERHPTNGQYRIVINNGTYSYFNIDNIVEFGQHGTKLFKDGSKCVIRLKLPLH